MTGPREIDQAARADWASLCEAQREREKGELKSKTREQLEAAHMMMMYALRDVADSIHGAFESPEEQAAHCVNAASSALYNLGDKEYGGWRK